MASFQRKKDLRIAEPRSTVEGGMNGSMDVGHLIFLVPITATCALGYMLEDIGLSAQH